MVIGNRLIKNEPVHYLGSDRIIYKNSVRYLGLLIDGNLEFTSHVIRVKAKLSQLAGILHIIKRCLNIKTSKINYYSCAYSVITYLLGEGFLPVAREHKLLIGIIRE